MSNLTHEFAAVLTGRRVMKAAGGAAGFFVIVVAWSLGVAIEKYLSVHVPGPIIGIGILFISLSLVPHIHTVAARVAHLLLANLQLFFFPLGAGFLTLHSETWRFYATLFAITLSSLIVCQILCATLFSAIRRGPGG